MARSFLTDVDLTKKELRNARIQNLATDPSTPVLGQTYFNTGSNKLRTYNGSTWDEYGTSTASGDVTGPSSSVDSEIALFSSTTGKVIKRATLSGLVKATSGVASAATAGTDYYNPGGTDVAVLDGGTGASTASAARTNLGLVIGTDVLAPNGSGASLTGIPESAVTNLTTDLAAKAPLASPTFTGTVTVPTPSGGTDAANKAYVDSAAAGIDWKASVRAASTANGTLATAYANGSVIDGVTLATGNRILLKNQTTGSENGIYTVNASGAPTRATDADTSAEVTPGMAVFIEEGTSQADTGWVMTNSGAITLGTTALTFVQFTGLGEVTAGTGLSKSGNTMSIDTTVTVDKTTSQALSNKDLTAGTNTFPTFNQNTTGSAAKLTTARNLNGVAFDGTAAITIPANKLTATYGDGSTTAFAVTHGLGQQWVIVQLYEVSTGNMVEADVQVTSSTVVTITHSVAPTTNQYRYVIIG